MATQDTPNAGDFVKFLLLSVVTFGIYPAWWQYSRTETIYRTVQRER